MVLKKKKCVSYEGGSYIVELCMFMGRTDDYLGLMCELMKSM